jgi:putative flippase GtrA
MTDFRQLGWFGLVGGGAALLYAVQVYVYTKNFGWSAPFGSTFAYLMCGVVSYSGNRLFTFQSNAPLAPEVSRFVLTSVLGMAISAAIPFVLTEMMHVAAWISFAVVCLAVPTMNFVLHSRFVYATGMKGAAR